MDHLLPYQKYGVEKLLTHSHFYLADDMGLGKSLQVIEFLNQFKALKVLIICPASVKYNWFMEIEKWYPGKWEIHLIKNTNDRPKKKANIFIVNYELLLCQSIHNQLSELAVKIGGFDVGVCDEAHYLKEPKAKRTEAVLSRTKGILRLCARKILLSGTPVLSKPQDIFLPLRVLAPKALYPYTEWPLFIKRYCGAKEKKTLINEKEIKKYKYRDVPKRYAYHLEMGNPTNVEELAQKLQHFLLRRTKEDVLEQLPDKIEKTIFLNPPNKSQIQGLELEETELATLRRLIGEAKVPEVIKYIKDLLLVENKIVVFAYHRNVIEALGEGLAEYDPVLFYGGTSIHVKEMLKNSFTDDKSKNRVFIGQITSAGQGIDGLQKVANHVIFAELDWTPGIMDQAVDRCRRIGQKLPVIVHYLLLPGTLEDKMSNILNRKRNLITRLIDNKEIFNMATLEEILTSIDTSVKKIESYLDKLTSIPLENTKNLTPDTPEKKEPETTSPVDSQEPSNTSVKRGRPKKEMAEASLAEESSPTLMDLKQAAETFVNSTPDKENNKIKARKILANFGANKLAELHESQWPLVIAQFSKGPDAIPDEDTDEL